MTGQLEGLQGTLLTERFRQRELTVYLPPSYGKAGGARFPVAYVMDGSMLFDPAQNEALPSLERMFSAGELGELMLVGVSAVSRLDEYTPWPAAALSASFPDFGGKGGAHLSFLADALKPHIDGRYATDSRPAASGLVGASLGGLLSLYALYREHGAFGRFGSISGSLWYEGFLAHIRTNAVKQPFYRLYMDVGSLEGAEKQNLQKTMVPNTLAAYALLRREEATRLVVEEGAVHGAAHFARRFPDAIRWLYDDYEREND